MNCELDTKKLEISNGCTEPMNLLTSGSEHLMSKKMAHRILNMTKAGLQINPKIVEQALIITGDL